MLVKKFHGKDLRGLTATPRSVSFEGRFGRMFRSLKPAHHTDAALKALADAMVAEFEEVPTPETEVDDEENQGIDAGYTYLGQFIDHDITFDPASSLQKQNDPDGLEDFRTPRFDLDNVYGRGPDDQPYLYHEDGKHLLLGRQLTGNPKDANSRDLPRNAPATGDKRALIGDPRNDENVIVSQLQSTFIRFHNRVADILIAEHADCPFEDIQKQVRWHYQWIVLTDFLPTIVGKDMVKSVLGTLPTKDKKYDPHKPQLYKPDLHFFRWEKNPFMPVEFSVAAYRFGHSMVRPIYRLNSTLANRQVIFSGGRTQQNGPYNPATEVESLVGFREFPSNWAIDWDLFFNPGNAPSTGKDRIQKAYKIDTSLVNPLGNLPHSVASAFPSLALRNLLRGRSMGLPSGQAVARQMHMPVIPDADLRIGKATEGDSANNPTLVSRSAEFKGNAPLWYYILAEAQQHFKKNSDPIHLGPVGGRIVSEVFVGLMWGDKHSFLSQEPTWRPRADFGGENFRMKDLIGQALKDHA